MSNRWFNTNFWLGQYVQELEPIEKLVYVYLINYPQSNIAGVFDNQPKRYAFDLNMDRKDVETVLKKLENDGKIVITHGKIALTKWAKHQAKNPSVVDGIVRELANLPTECIQALSQSGYSLPPGCSWKKILTQSQSQETLQNTQPVPSLSTDSPQDALPYLTLPNLTLPNLTSDDVVAGVGVNEGGESPADEWYNSAENVLGLSEFEVRALDRPEYDRFDIYLDDIYKKTCAEVLAGSIRVKSPRKFFEGRVTSIYQSKS